MFYVEEVIDDQEVDQVETETVVQQIIIRGQHTVISVFIEEQDVESTIIIIVDIWVIIEDIIACVEVDLEEEPEEELQEDLEEQVETDTVVQQIIIRGQHIVTSVFTEEQDVESTIIIIVDIWVIIADFIVGVEVDLEEEPEEEPEEEL